MKEHFSDKQSAFHYANRVGGKVYDNRHNSIGYRGNDFTVTKPKKKESYSECSGEHTRLQWSQEEFGLWLDCKDWSEDIKQYHRREFKGFISFEDDGSFYYD